MNPWGFLFPLTPMVWGALLLALLGVWLVMMILDFRPNKRYGLAWVSAQLFNQVSVLLQQGLSITLESTWQRVIACSWLIVVALCSWSYSGNLMSQLAVRYVPQKIKTVQNMVDDKRLTVIQLNNTALTDYLKAVQSGVFRDVALMWNQGRMRYIPNQDFPTALDTLVRRGDHVMMTTCMTANLYMSDLYTKEATCDFYKAKEEFLPLALGLIGQKDSPLMPAIDSRISYVLAAGLYDYWLMSSIENSSACVYSPSKITVQEPLALSNIWGLYAITATGLLLSLVVFLLELISARVSE